MDKYAFGNYLTALRTRRGLSQSELGAIVGVSNKAISKWENGEALPRLERLKALADYFGVSVEELVADGKIGEDVPKTEPQPTIRNGETPEEVQHRIALQTAYRKKQEHLVRRWTKILLCCDPIGFALAAVIVMVLGFAKDAADLLVSGVILTIVSACLVYINRLVWRGFDIARKARIVCYFTFMIQCFPIVRDVSALSGGLQSLLFWLICLMLMAFSAANFYLFAFYRPVRDFLTEQSYYRHL